MKTILIVDDVPTNIKILGEMLRGQYVIIVANNGVKAVHLTKEQRPDLILMDVMMPVMDGFTASSLIRRDEATADIPIIFLTAKNETDDIVKGFTSGGVDYVVKPFNAVELHARIRTHLELVSSRSDLKKYASELALLNGELQQKNKFLAETLEQFAVMAKTDHLTGLANRHHFMEKVREEIARFNRNHRAFSIVIGDIDDFKKINDSYGHDCGDAVLRDIAAMIRSTVRETDLPCRWGGEEFIIILTETDGDEAEELAERLRTRVEGMRINYTGKSITLRMTLGVSTVNSLSDIDGLIKSADNALYHGKGAGRNRVVRAFSDKGYQQRNEAVLSVP